MLKTLSPVARLCIGITSLTLSLVLAAQFLGLIVDGSQTQLKARARLSEALTIQLSSAASRDDITAITQTITAITERDPAIRSIAMRKANGQVIAVTKDHPENWQQVEGNISSPTHVQIPLYNDSQLWGRVELAFTPLEETTGIFGMPMENLKLLGFFLLSGFVGYYFLLRRALKELDPGNVVPDRVQAAFDTLAEGVAIIDEHEHIMLINRSLAEITGEPVDSLKGVKLSNWKWRRWKGEQEVGMYPWQTAISNGESSVQMQMGLRLNSREIRNFNVNASSILNEKGQPTGAIVTFKDITVLEKQNENLALAVHKLQETESEITQQNRELQYLANHDPLSGCLNRRSLFEGFDEKFAKARENEQPLSCLMVDLDHFKSINDRFGHAIGDEVIVGVAQILAACCREGDLVGRYGGEEFCVVLDGLDQEQAAKVAERIRRDVIAKSQTWLQIENSVSVSIGLASIKDGAVVPNDIVNQADKALYSAKESGRNRVISWSELAGDNQGAVQEQVPVSKVVHAEAPPTNNAPSIPATNQTQVSAAGDVNDQVDALTGLPSQPVFMERLENSIGRARREKKSVAVLYLSVDSTAKVAEAFGESESAEIIKIASNRLSTVLRRTDTISLLGGKDRLISFSRSENSKFLIEIPELNEISSVTWIIQRLFKSFAEPWPVNGNEYYLKCCIGVSLFPEDGVDANNLVQCSIQAHNQANSENRISSFRFFSKDMGNAAKQQLELESGIHEALLRNQFALYYQPIIDVSVGKITSAEALLRCTNPKLRNIPIQMLINVAEQCGLMQKVGDWIIREAISQMKRWEQSGMDLPMLSINISAAQLNDKAAAERLHRYVIDSNCNPARFQFEVTETNMLKDISKAGDMLKRLQKLGAQIALDDFGTGQSSLTYIQKLQPDAIKIDRSFVDDINKSYSNEAMVASVTELSARLGLRVVAEGVETQDQLDTLMKLGCREIQGYLVAAPMPEKLFADWTRLFSQKKQADMPASQARTASR